MRTATDASSVPVSSADQAAAPVGDPPITRVETQLDVTELDLATEQMEDQMRDELRKNPADEKLRACLEAVGEARSELSWINYKISRLASAVERKSTSIDAERSHLNELMDNIPTAVKQPSVSEDREGAVQRHAYTHAVATARETLSSLFDDYKEISGQLGAAQLLEIKVASRLFDAEERLETACWKRGLINTDK